MCMNACHAVAVLERISSAFVAMEKSSSSVGVVQQQQEQSRGNNTFTRKLNPADYQPLVPLRVDVSLAGTNKASPSTPSLRIVETILLDPWVWPLRPRQSLNDNSSNKNNNGKGGNRGQTFRDNTYCFFLFNLMLQNTKNKIKSFLYIVWSGPAR